MIIVIFSQFQYNNLTCILMIMFAKNNNDDVCCVSFVGNVYQIKVAYSLSFL